MAVYGFNIPAIIVVTVLAQVIGALWYGKLFTRTWMAEMGFTDETMAAAARKSGKRPYVIALITALVLAVALSWANIMAASAGVGDGIVVGLIVGIGMVAASAAPHYAFSGRSLRLFLIDEGQTLTSIVVMSAILGWWR